MKRCYYVRVGEETGCPVTVSDEPWQGDLAVTDASAITADRIFAAARRKLGLPLLIAETERLILRELWAEDQKRFAGLLTEEAELQKAGMNTELLRDQTCLEAYIRTQYCFFEYGLWGVFLRESRELIGLIGFSPGNPPELGYYISQKYRRRGYALEAGRAVFCYAKRELFFGQIALRIERGNTASLALAEALSHIALAIPVDLSLKVRQ